MNDLSNLESLVGPLPQEDVEIVGREQGWTWRCEWCGTVLSDIDRHCLCEGMVPDESE